MADFGKRFGVDLSSFQFQRHFGSELDAGGRWVVRKVFGGDAVQLSPVTLQDLLDAANRGRWIEHETHEVNQSPEPTAVGALRSAIAVHAANRRWLSFFR